MQGEIDADVQGIFQGDMQVSLKSVIPGRDATVEQLDEQEGKERDENEA